MSTFVFAKFAIHDRAGYSYYVELATPIFIREKVIIHASDEEPLALSPDMKADKVVLLEFRDYAHFEYFFSQADYMEAAKIRDAASTISATVFERFKMPT
jgi:uncharacterized protein (DUF1330 family)